MTIEIPGALETVDLMLLYLNGGLGAGLDATNWAAEKLGLRTKFVFYPGTFKASKMYSGRDRVYAAYCFSVEGYQKQVDSISAELSPLAEVHQRLVDLEDDTLTDIAEAENEEEVAKGERDFQKNFGNKYMHEELDINKDHKEKYVKPQDEAVKAARDKKAKAAGDRRLAPFGHEFTGGRARSIKMTLGKVEEQMEAVASRFEVSKIQLEKATEYKENFRKAAEDLPKEYNDDYKDVSEDIRDNRKEINEIDEEIIELEASDDSTKSDKIARRKRKRDELFAEIEELKKDKKKYSDSKDKASKRLSKLDVIEQKMSQAFEKYDKKTKESPESSEPPSTPDETEGERSAPLIGSSESSLEMDSSDF